MPRDEVEPRYSQGQIDPSEITPGTPQAGFTAERIGYLCGILRPHQTKIVAEMQAANPSISPEVANQIFVGELARVSNLGAALWPLAYQFPLEHLTQAKVIPQHPSVVELGSSSAIHVAAFPSAFRPETYRGVEISPHMIAFAREAMRLFREDGAIPKTEHTIINGDHKTALPDKYDVAMSSLVAQYSPGEEGLYNWTDNNAAIGVTFDTIHCPTLINREQLEDGSLLIRSGRTPHIDTGIHIRLLSEPRKTLLGDRYEATLTFDPKVIGPEKSIVYLSAEQKALSLKVNVFAKGEQLYIEPWTIEFLEGMTTEEENIELAAFHETIREVFTEIGPATNGREVWDSRAAAALPAYAASQGKYSAITMYSSVELPSTFIMSLMRRAWREVVITSQAGRLTHVGEGKQFADIGKLNEAITKWVRPGNASRFGFACPPFITVITASDRSVIERLARTNSP